MSHSFPQQNIEPDEKPHHGPFLFIPTFIADDPSLDGETVLLFGRIMALSNQIGHCFASDKYLAELTRCSDREVKRRIKLLEDKGYIHRETLRDGMIWKRKIFVTYSMNSNKVYEGTKPSPRRDQAVPCKGLGRPNNKISYNKISYNNITPPPQTPPLKKPPEQKHEGMPSAEEEDFYKNLGREKKLSAANLMKLKSFSFKEVKRAVLIAEKIKPKKTYMCLLLNILNAPDRYEDPESGEEPPKQTSREEKEEILKRLEKNRLSNENLFK